VRAPRAGALSDGFPLLGPLPPSSGSAWVATEASDCQPVGRPDGLSHVLGGDSSCSGRNFALSLSPGVLIGVTIVPCLWRDRRGVARELASIGGSNSVLNQFRVFEQSV
jgi:hypothetical protein